VPYTPDTAPDYVKRQLSGTRLRQWVDVWNSAYVRALEKGASHADAEASAFMQAHAVAGVRRRGDCSHVRPAVFEKSGGANAVPHHPELYA